MTRRNDLQPGDLVGPYRVETRLGEGGMGEVYLATDTRLDRSVALKLPLISQRGDETLSRLRREARAAARLNHANVVTLCEIAEHAGRPVLVMEHVEGRQLTALVAERPPLRQAVRIRDPWLPFSRIVSPSICLPPDQVDALLPSPLGGEGGEDTT